MHQFYVDLKVSFHGNGALSRDVKFFRHFLKGNDIYPQKNELDRFTMGL